MPDLSKDSDEIRELHQSWTVKFGLALTGSYGLHAYADETAYFGTLLSTSTPEIVARFTIEGEPVSKARARFTKHGSRVQTYTPARTKTAEEVVGWAFRRVAPRHSVDGRREFGVFAIFHCSTRQRRDVDNMLKLICDGLNGVAWKDDSQVTEACGRRAWSDEARTEVLIYRFGDRPERTTPCKGCGKPLLTYPSWGSHTRYCSAECR